ncbi:MAG TPA: Na-translocating system protein MpsC family protein [Solirubrobacteraceae bacterium]|nr:Na-translocating system protein MpsC family protein [Solirubrobacteraceae bacterium]
MISSEAPTTEGLSEHDGSRPLALLSREIVRIYKDQFGRGPTKVRSHFAGPDIVVCVLENTFTPAEKNLQGMGEHQRLRDMRIFLQYASAGEFTDAVERSIGRRVRSFVSGIDTNSDIACELFVLEPQTSG